MSEQLGHAFQLSTSLNFFVWLGGVSKQQKVVLFLTFLRMLNSVAAAKLRNLIHQKTQIYSFFNMHLILSTLSEETPERVRSLLLGYLCCHIQPLK